VSQTSNEVSANQAPSVRPKREGAHFPTHVTRELAVLVDPGSSVAQGLVSITSQLQHMHVDMGVRSFCFIGDDAKCGTTVAAANVAASFAMSGLRTILIESNFRSPRIAAMFGLDTSRPGLSEWVAGIGETSAWSSYMQPGYPNLMIVPAGSALKQGEAYLSTELQHIVMEMSRMFDVVICDAAPMSDVAGTLAVVAAVERTIIVARANRTRMNTLVEFGKIVEKCRGVVAGSIYMDF
jgi:protein-tyrosine kinase